MRMRVFGLAATLTLAMFYTVAHVVADPCGYYVVDYGFWEGNPCEPDPVDGTCDSIYNYWFVHACEWHHVGGECGGPAQDTEGCLQVEEEVVRNVRGCLPDIFGNCNCVSFPGTTTVTAVLTYSVICVPEQPAEWPS